MKLKVNSWYLNVHRTIERIGQDNLPPGFLNHLKEIANHALSKGLLVASLGPVVVAWVRLQKIKPLEELLLTGELQKGVTFTFEGRFRSSGLAGKKQVKGDDLATLRLKLKEFGQPKELVVRFHPDGLTTSSARSALSGQPSVFLVAYVDSISDAEVGCRPYVIGDLVKEIGTEHSMDFPYRHTLEVRPELFDALKCVDFTQRLRESDLSALKDVPELTVKHAFAEILGEPNIPKDWGGESCDLFSENVLVEGMRTICAFAFKGPSKFKPMEIADCGKNGDQIVRLFDTPAEILVLQHCHSIRPAVRKMMAAFARSDLNTYRRYCVVDGYETLKILKHFKRV